LTWSWRLSMGRLVLEQVVLPDSITRQYDTTAWPCPHGRASLVYAGLFGMGGHDSLGSCCCQSGKVRLRLSVCILGSLLKRGAEPGERSTARQQFSTRCPLGYRPSSVSSTRSANRFSRAAPAITSMGADVPGYGTSRWRRKSSLKNSRTVSSAAGASRTS
jgi:hypothetical protein